MPRQYTVIDLNAGPGHYLLRDGEPADGTPLLVTRRLAKSGLAWRAAFVEKDAAAAAHLRHWLAIETELLSVPKATVDVLEGDSESVVLPWASSSVPPSSGLGLLIHDPNGAPDMKLLETQTKSGQFRRFDVAVYVQATSLKRVLNQPTDRFNTIGWLPLDEALRRVKPMWVVRTPSGSNQYALCIGSNGSLGADWTRMGFWTTDSPRGQQILERLTFTVRERHDRLQPPLFE